MSADSVTQTPPWAYPPRAGGGERACAARMVRTILMAPPTCGALAWLCSGAVRQI